ncbi:MAG: hypothetical protein NCW75_05715 [Phycisphaera sp.]|nr:MAG: hypothetical protein NCW75_05715 [Phycisphaera sp.]
MAQLARRFCNNLGQGLSPPRTTSLATVVAMFVFEVMPGKSWSWPGSATS